MSQSKKQPVAMSTGVTGQEGAYLRELLLEKECAFFDLPDKCIFTIRSYAGEERFNIGSGTYVTMREFADLVCKVVGLDAKLEFDAFKPDGTTCKLLDVIRLAALSVCGMRIAMARLAARPEPRATVTPLITQLLLPSSPLSVRNSG